ncbi:MAG: GIY-YIG nuclease family protein, partial [Candidatus Neomarinimicrobiota bacterium]
MDYTVYILENPEGRIYIGQTNNLQDRLRRHNEGRSRYTRSNGPWQLVYSEVHPTRGHAVK